MGTITGVDISHHQRDVDFTQLATAARFVFLKATEGTRYVDPTFARRWALAKGARMVRGAYHFARPASPAKAQAQHFLKTVGAIERSDLLALDLEVADNANAASVASWAKVFLAEVEDATGRTPILYTGPGFWDAHVAPAGTVGFSRFPLWVAHYTTAPRPRLPKGFDRWAIWQFTSDGRAPGVSGRCDVNRCDEATLAALTGDHDQEDDMTPDPEVKQLLTDIKNLLTTVEHTVARWGRKNEYADEDQPGGEKSLQLELLMEIRDSLKALKP